MTTDIATPNLRLTGLADRPPPRRHPDRRGAATLAASVILHAAILIPMALRLFEVDMADRPPLPDTPIYIEIQPRPLLQGESSRVPTAAATATTVQTRPLTGPMVILRAPVRTPEEDERSDLPSIPVPRVGDPSGPAAAGAAAPPADIGAWQVVPDSIGARVGRSMRLGAGGCRIMDGRLNATEQRICDEAFNEAAGRASPLGSRTLTPGEVRREAEFARRGAAALALYEARRAPLRAGAGVVGPSDGVGSNFGTGVAGAHLPPVPSVDMRQGADSLIRQDSNKLDR